MDKLECGFEIRSFKIVEEDAADASALTAERDHEIFVTPAKVKRWHGRREEWSSEKREKMELGKEKKGKEERRKQKEN